MKKKNMMIATALPLLASGIILPFEKEGLVQTANAEGLNTVNETEQKVDGESFWKDKYSPWNMSFTVMKSGQGLVDMHYDGEKMVEEKRQSFSNLQQAKYLKTESGKVFSYGMPKDGLEGVVNPETKLIEPYPSADKHPFGYLNTKYYETKTLAYYKSVNQMAEINGILIATNGTPGSSIQYFSISRDNGETWQDVSATMKSYGYFEKISKQGDKLVAQRLISGKTVISESTDGLTWTDKFAISSPYSGLDVYELGKGEIVAYWNTGMYRSVDNGKTFTQQNILTGMARPSYVNGILSTFTKDGLFYSKDGVTWKASTKQALDVRKIYVDPIQNRFVALSKGYISISEDGDTWTTLDVNLPSEPLDIVFDNVAHQNKIVDNKVDLRTINDDLPLGKRLWEANTSHFLFYSYGYPKNFPAQLKYNYSAVGAFDSFYLKYGGKLILGYNEVDGIRTFKIDEYPNNVSYTSTNATTSGLKIRKTFLSKGNKLFTNFNTSYKGIYNGVAVFNPDDFINQQNSDVPPISLAEIKEGTPDFFFEGDGYVGMVATKDSSGNASSIVYISKDEGKTWEPSQELKGRLSSYVVTEKGKIVLFGDTFTASGKPVIYVSEDDGKTFKNIQGITTIGDSSYRTAKQSVAYRDGVYVWNIGRPYRSTDLVNWTPVIATGNINGSVDKEDVDYDPINDAFVLTGYNYVGLSRDGVSWRELTIHPYQAFEGVNFNNYKYDFLSLTLTSDAISKNKVPLNDWQKPADKEAPTAKVTLDTEEWTNKHATINVADIVDEGDGFDHMVLPDGTTSKESNLNFAVTENGSYAFKIYDKAGNMKEYVIDVNSIDKTPAKISVEPSTKEWSNGELKLDVSAIDEESSVDYIELPNGEKVESDKGDYRVSQNGEYLFKVVDKAGNESQYRYVVDNIDTTPATALIESDDAQTNKEEVTLTIMAEDKDSGISTILLPNGDVVENDNAIFKVSENGSYTFKVQDKAGNLSEFSYEVKNIKTSNSNEET